MSDPQCISGHDCWRFTNEMAAVIDAAREVNAYYAKYGFWPKARLQDMCAAVRNLEERTDQ